MALAVLLLTRGFSPPSASALPQSLFPLQNTMTPGGNAQIVARFDREDMGVPDDTILITVLPGSGGATLTLIQCVVGGANGVVETPPLGALVGDDLACVGPIVDADGLANQYGLTDTTVNAFDGNATAEQVQLVLRLRADTCTNQVYAFTAIQGLPAAGATLAGGESVTCSSVTNTPTPTSTPILSGVGFGRDTCFVPGVNLSDDRPPACAVVITADPNLVTCGGTSLITATVRDRDGHVVLGYGFHFATDHGLLNVGPPNNAGVESASAILRLFPPGSSNPTGSETATVFVSVGLALGTVEGTVTVQQHCSSDQTRAGAIAITASAPVVPCNGRVFLAATLRDGLGNPVPDDTAVTFLASAGSVGTAAVSAGGQTPTPDSGSSPSVTVRTQGGTANVIYTGDSSATGSVLVTVASGAAFGSITLQVCQAAGTTVRPPNTGTGFRIAPPNTGDGGVAR